CVPEYGPEEILRLISEERLTTLFLVPTMFHDVLRHPRFDSYDLRSLSRVGFAGMTMTPALIERSLDQLKPDLFVNYYGSSEIYTFSYCDHLDRKPGSAKTSCPRRWRIPSRAASSLRGAPSWECRTSGSAPRWWLSSNRRSPSSHPTSSTVCACAAGSPVSSAPGNTCS